MANPAEEETGMQLYLLRHAIAVDRDQFRGHDRERPLTAEGKAKMRRAAKGMRALELSFDLILSSPYVRARDTAEIVADVLANRRHLKLTDLLAPDANLKEMVEHLAKLPRGRDVLLVGHEPQLSTLLATLVGARASERLKLKKGALCLLTVEEIRFGPCAKLEWLLTSKQLSLLTGSGGRGQ